MNIQLEMDAHRRLMDFCIGRIKMMARDASPADYELHLAVERLNLAIYRWYDGDEGYAEDVAEAVQMLRRLFYRGRRPDDLMEIDMVASCMAEAMAKYVELTKEARP